MKVLVPGAPDLGYVSHAIDLSQPLVFEQPEVLDAAECEAMIARAEQHDFADAPITTSHGFVQRPELRNNTRVMFDDLELAATLFDRIAGVVPARLSGRRAVGVNERFRCYRYLPGQRFKAHYDGCFERNARERSELTFMVYLDARCTGGNTMFLDFGVEVVPAVGKALFFQHALLHEGATVTDGVKYVLRSDVMYAA
jgi:predicted 2-oxoglutarate/Fe(II)-dependent dioxygenase YbiX